MNDYKELVFNLMFLAKYCHSEYNDLCVDDELKKAADAIEQLVKERDAAVGQLEAAGFCDYCKHRDIEKQHCNKHGKCYWEWRGVKEDNDE